MDTRPRKKMIAHPHQSTMERELCDNRSLAPPPRAAKKIATFSKLGEDTICKSLEMAGNANEEFTQQERLMMQHKKHLEAPHKDSVRIRDTSSATVDTSWKPKAPKDTLGLQSKEKQPVIHTKDTYKSKVFDDTSVSEPRRQKQFVEAPSNQEKPPHPSRKAFENHSFLLSDTIQNNHGFTHKIDERSAKKAVSVEIKEKLERPAKKSVSAPQENKTKDERPSKKMQSTGHSAFVPTNNIFCFAQQEPTEKRSAKRVIVNESAHGQLNLFA